MVDWCKVRKGPGQEAGTGKQYVPGQDKQGRNVLVMRPGQGLTNPSCPYVCALSPNPAIFVKHPSPS